MARGDKLEEIVIDNIKYLINAKGIVYDPDTYRIEGAYDREKKVWFSIYDVYGECMCGGLCC